MYWRRGEAPPFAREPVIAGNSLDGTLTSITDLALLEKKCVNLLEIFSMQRVTVTILLFVVRHKR
jgi:hypothetical protein